MLKSTAFLLALLFVAACTKEGDDDDTSMTAGVGGALAGTMAMASGSGGQSVGGSGGMTAGTVSMTGGSGGTMMMAGGSGGTMMGGGMGGTMMMGGTGGTMEPPNPAGPCVAPAPSADPGVECKNSAPPGIKATMIASGLQSPVYVAQAPGDSTRLYVLEQAGTIRVVKDGTLSPTPFLDLGSAVNAAGLGFYSEAGLLGMAFHPDFANNKRFWLAFTKGAGYAISVSEYTMDNPDAVDGGSGTEKISLPQNGFNHKGGMLAFGPDNCLYVSTGDGGSEGDPTGTGQGTNDMLGVMLRFDVDNFSGSAPGNVTGHIWSQGIRNTWRFSFDRVTGDMYMGDVGQDSGSGFEEVNVEPKGTPGRNYGWSDAEGSTVCRGDCAGFTKPAQEYPVTDGANSVIGGYVYRGKAIPEMVGRYIYADWTERKLKTFIWSGEENGEANVCDVADAGVTIGQKVRGFGEDNDGEIYVVAAGSGSGLAGGSLTEDGFLYKIEPM